MCYQLSLVESIENISKRYRRKADPSRSEHLQTEDEYRISAYNFPEYPVVTSDPEIQIAAWGLIPSWIKDPMDAYEIRRKTLNARAETIFKKVSYRDSARSKRCIIPATGFFEWRHENKKTVPYYIYPPNKGMFSIAGLYDTWEDPDTGDLIKTFTLITTRANPLMSYIHNTKCRMPAILLREEEEIWLDPAASPREVEKMLKPYPEQDMKAYIVSSDFLRMNPNDPAIIEETG